MSHHNINNQDLPNNENENHLIGNILAEDNSGKAIQETSINVNMIRNAQ